jgi:small subunit ribosomal protein S21
MTREEVSFMAVIVQVRKGETIDKALRRLKKRLDREGVIREVREKQYFEKPCAKRRRKKKMAKFANYLRLKNENM